MSMLKPWAPQLLSVLRIMLGLLFFEHGLAKLAGFPHVPAYDAIPVGSLPWIGGILELVGGALLAIGLFTRITAFILSGEMAVAYFLVHAPHGFFPILNQGELAIVYCFAFLYLAAAGGGAWSLDRARGAIPVSATAA